MPTRVTWFRFTFPKPDWFTDIHGVVYAWGYDERHARANVKLGRRMDRLPNGTKVEKVTT